MHFKTLADTEFKPDQIQRFIALFDKRGESGPHSFEGRLLSHVLNHCVAYDIPYTLVFVPTVGYYVKRAYPDGFIPARVVADFKYELQDASNRACKPLDEDLYGMLYDLETIPDTISRAEDMAAVFTAALGPDYNVAVEQDGVGISCKVEGGDNA